MKMKKYLMTGIAALALCAGFTSCSHDLDSYSPDEIKELEAQKIVNNYQKAFTATFGKVAANQTWGFGAANTRTRGFSTNHNLWGDPTADGGKWNFKVPPALTERQKLRVKLYFQYNPWLTYEDPEWTDFFVQQVYKGGTSPIASQSLESYPTGDGGTVIGGEQMDKLTVGYPGEGGQADNYYDHVNDFNNANYDGGNTVPVLNTGASTNNYSTDSHDDQITLMLDSKSDCVGYWDSDGATGHNDRCALAGAAEIDAWAASTAAQNLGIDLGDPVYEEEWNRSFVGLDYDGVYGDNIYKKGDFDENGNWNNNIIKYAKIADAKQKDYLWDGQQVWKFDDYIAENGPYFLDKEGNKVPYTISERNMFIGTNSDLEGGQNAYIIQKYVEEFQREVDVIDITVIQDKIDDACLPCNGNLYQWTKNIGGRDHVYSDWIVTLTKAEKQDEIITDPTDYAIRVMAEDLSASESSDFDFNDVVFDVTYNTDDANAIVTLRAAGGTLPLIVAVNNPADDQDYTENEVHHLFGEPTNIMINTGRGGADGANNKTASRTISVPFSNINSEDDFLTAVKNIKVWVKKSVSQGDGTTTQKWFELTANEGEACCKFACGPDYEWCPERTNIDKVYTFSAWVQGFSTTLLPVDNNE